MENINFENLGECQPEVIAAIPSEKMGLVLFEIIQTVKIDREYRKIAMEKIEKLEGEIDTLRKRVDTAERALLRAIDNLAAHTHTPAGIAAVPLTP